MFVIDNHEFVIKQDSYLISEGIHDEIISEEDWNLAQKKRQETGVGNEKVHSLEHEHILSSIVKCPEISITDGYKLKLNTNSSNTLQEFKFIKNSNGTYKIVNRQVGNGYVIEIPNNSYNISDPLKMAYNSNVDSNQNQQWVLEEISDMITSAATYSSDGNYLSTTTDSRGKVTNYSYNKDKGTLDSVTNANNVATNYTYNQSNDALESIAQSGVRVGYTYKKDKLDTITTGNNNVYSFGYDNFNRNTSVSVGTQLLVTNIYDKRGLLTESTYGVIMVRKLVLLTIP